MAREHVKKLHLQNTVENPRLQQVPHTIASGKAVCSGNLEGPWPGGQEGWAEGCSEETAGG